MGMWKNRWRCGTNVTAPAPNPENFRLLKVEQVGRCLVVLVEYPGCTNYEARKLMIFAGKSESWVRSRARLDPHFQNHHDAPIIRLRPDLWAAAIAIARQI